MKLFVFFALLGLVLGQDAPDSESDNSNDFQLPPNAQAFFMEEKNEKGNVGEPVTKADLDKIFKAMEENEENIQGTIESNEDPDNRARTLTQHHPGGGYTGGGYPGYFPNPLPRPTCPNSMAPDGKWCYRRCEHVYWQHNGCRSTRCMFKPTKGKSICGADVDIYPHPLNGRLHPAGYCTRPNAPCSSGACNSHSCKKKATHVTGYCPTSRCKQQYYEVTETLYAKLKCDAQYRRMQVKLYIPGGCACRASTHNKHCSCPFGGNPFPFPGQGPYNPDPYNPYTGPGTSPYDPPFPGNQGPFYNEENTQNHPGYTGNPGYTGSNPFPGINPYPNDPWNPLLPPWGGNGHGGLGGLGLC